MADGRLSLVRAVLTLQQIIDDPLDVPGNKSFRDRIEILTPKRAEFAGAVVRRRARLHADKTRLEGAKQFEYLIATNLPSKNGSAVIGDAMNLEDVLRDIQTDGANLRGDGSSAAGWPD